MVAFANPLDVTPDGSPDVAFSVIGRIPDGGPAVDLFAAFRHKVDFFRFQMRLASVGGTVLETGIVVYPESWFESVDDANALIGYPP